MRTTLRFKAACMLTLAVFVISASGCMVAAGAAAGAGAGYIAGHEAGKDAAHDHDHDD